MAEKRTGWRRWTLGIVLAGIGGAAMSAPALEQTLYGRLDDGRAVHVYTLTGGRGISAKILDYGGVITEINVPDRRGRVQNVVLGFGGLAAYTATATMNALVGRYANRLKNGFDLDGVHYPLTQDAKGLTLHGGPSRYGSRLWTAQAAPAGASGAALVLSLDSPDGDQGFPGALHVRVTYRVTDAGEFTIDYEAVTGKPTVINLTNHVYFNLAGNGSGSVYGQRLQVLADDYTPADADQVPTGVIAPVAGTALDFREMRAIGERVASSEPQMLLARGYDHNYVLRKPAAAGPPSDAAPGHPPSATSGPVAAAGPAPARGLASSTSPIPPLAARLYDPDSGRLLELRTTEPGLQVYSANSMTGALVSAAGTTLRQGDGLALETQHFPNSPNVPAFPSTVLRPGETFRSTTRFRFSNDAAEPLR